MTHHLDRPVKISSLTSAVVRITRAQFANHKGASTFAPSCRMFTASPPTQLYIYSFVRRMQVDPGWTARHCPRSSGRFSDRWDSKRQSRRENAVTRRVTFPVKQPYLHVFDGRASIRCSTPIGRNPDRRRSTCGLPSASRVCQLSRGHCCCLVRYIAGRVHPNAFSSRHGLS
jgi:hypothetical protein